MSEPSTTDVFAFTQKQLDQTRALYDTCLTAHWSRDTTELSSLDPARDSLALFQMEITSSATGCPAQILSQAANRGHPEHLQLLSKTSPAPVPVIQIFGVTAGGSSVLVNVYGMFPYLYCPCPPSLVQHLDTVSTVMDDFLKSSYASRGLHARILDMSVVYRKSLQHYVGDDDVPFFRVTLASPSLVAPLRSAIEAGITVRLPHGASADIPTSVFEANIPFELRFMVDSSMPGCSWIELPASRYYRSSQKLSTCQLELDVCMSDIIAHPAEGIWQTIPPLRVLSFDIECVTESGRGFPAPETDKVIQIASVLACHGKKRSRLPTPKLFQRSGAVVCWFETESEMLLRWRDLVVETDPDIITGYNCINFDLNYLIVRSDVLKLDVFKHLSRLTATKSKIRDTVLSSRGLGTHENKSISKTATKRSHGMILDIDGRIQMDMLEVIRRDYKLKSYTLNAVSAHFLKEQKEDVHYSMLGELFAGNEETRRRVATYCLKDAYLPLRLMQKLLVIVNYVEMSRVTGTPLSFLLTRGQQIKVTSQLLRKCKELGYLFPSVRTQGRGADDREKAYEGATVLEPLKGLYKMPVATLDFASLYPSIMMAHNLCYSTLCQGPISRLGLREEDVTRTPSNSVFVKTSKRRGVLPLIVEDLLSARKRARKELAQATDEMTRMVLNGRQLALKLSANSVYGYTGAITGGQLPCLEVSTAITAYGREMIEFTKSTVESHYTVANGYTVDATVVYGDTDSVMVLFGVTDIAEAMRLGQEAADLVTTKFVPPIRLEFEKVFCPFLLMNKKRYAGVLYTSPEKFSRIDCKGIETVRRDFCLLVQQLVDTVLRKLLLEQDEEAAQNYTRQVISDLLQNRVDLSLLVMSKSLGKEEYTSKLAHVELAKKMKQRDPGTAPQIGDRVHFVIIPGVKGQAQYDRAEDPVYVLENNLTVDTQYYLDNIKNPVTRIFEGVMDNPETLFAGSHTHKKKVLTSSAGAMSKFVKASLRCIGCRSVIKSGALCVHCEKEKHQEIVLAKLTDLCDKEAQFSRLWVECQRCQGSLEQEVLCTSRDCPIFYRRMKIKNDIDEAQSQVDRLQLDW